MSLSQVSRTWVGSLRRVTSSGRFIPEIDGLRFIAIAFVVLFHIYRAIPAYQNDWTHPDPSHQDSLAALVRQGEVGVDLFFAISGFILALPFAEQFLQGGKPFALKQYFLRRVTRLEPPYIICLFLTFLMQLISERHRTIAEFPNFLASLFYSHNIVFGRLTRYPPTGWSLEVEVQFYILAPLLARMFLLRPAVLRRIGILLTMLALAALQNRLPLTPGSHAAFAFHRSIVFKINYFLAGFLLADFYVTNWRERPKKTFVWDLVATLGFIGAIWARRLPNIEAYAVPLLIFAAYVGVLRGRLWSAFTSLPWITVIGGMCYTIYLYHFQILSLVKKVTLHIAPTRPPWQQLIIQTVLVVPPILLVCTVLFSLFERPFMFRDWPARVMSSWRALWGSPNPRPPHPELLAPGAPLTTVTVDQESGMASR